MQKRGGPMQNVNKKGKAIPVTDNAGNAFPTLAAMARHHDLNYNTLNANIKNGMTPGDAVDKMLKNKTERQNRYVEDHLGNKFKTLREMAKHYGITEKALQSRTARGMPLEQALTTPLKTRACEDHLGNKFASVAEMARHYGLSTTILYQRLMRMPLDEALQPFDIKAKEQTDHLGNTFHSINAMAKYYGLADNVLRDRLETMPIEDACLHIRLDRSNATTNYGPGLHILKHLYDRFYEITLYDEKMIWHANDILSYYRKHCLENNGTDLIIKK